MKFIAPTPATVAMADTPLIVAVVVVDVAAVEAVVVMEAASRLSHHFHFSFSYLFTYFVINFISVAVVVAVMAMVAEMPAFQECGTVEDGLEQVGPHGDLIDSFLII